MLNLPVVHDQYLSPYFAAGKVFTNAVFDSVMAQVPNCSKKIKLQTDTQKSSNSDNVEYDCRNTNRVRIGHSRYRVTDFP